MRFDSTAEGNIALTTVIVGFARSAFEDFMVPAELVARRALSAHRAIYTEGLLVTAMIAQDQTRSCKLRLNKDREQRSVTTTGADPKEQLGCPT